MTDESESLEKLVARLIAEQLREGGLERLIQAHKAITQHIQLAGIESEEAFGNMTVTGGIGATLQPPQASFGLSLEPSFSFKAEVVDAIESASPKLANEIRKRDPQNAMLLITLFMALMQAVQFLLSVQSEPPTPTQIVQIYNQTTNNEVNVQQGPPSQ